MDPLIISNGVVSTGLTADKTQDIIVLGGGSLSDSIATNSGIIYTDSDYANPGTNVHGGGLQRISATKGGEVWVYNYGSAMDITAEEQGYFNIAEGSIDSGLVHSGGCGIIFNDGTADHVTAADGGTFYNNGGKVRNTVVSSGGLFIVQASVAETFGTTVLDSGVMRIVSEGNATDTVVNGGFLEVESGTATKTVISAGSMRVSSGGIARDLTINNGGEVIIDKGGNLTGKMTFETGAGSVAVFDGGTIDFDLRQTTTLADPLLNDFSFVTDDKLSFTLTVDGTQANGLYYLAGNAADFGDRTLTVVNASGETLGTLTVADGTKEIDGVEYTLKQYGPCLYLWVGGEKYDLTGKLWDENFNLKDGKVAGSVFVMERANLNIADGGIALDTTVYPEGAIDVSKDGTANGVTVDGGDVDVSAGGTVNGATVDYGWMRVSAGGTVNGATVDSGWMYVSAGGTAVGIVASAGAALELDVAPDTYVQGTYDGSAFEIKDGFVGGYTIHDGCELNVSNGGKADNTTVNAGGWMYVSEGGTADNTTVNAGGRMYVQNGGTAQQLKENGGWVEIYDGAIATFVSNSFSGTVLQNWHSATVHSGTTATDVAVNANGWFLVNGGVASQANVNADGLLTVKDGGSAGGAKVKAGGQIHIYDGTAGNTTVSSGGEMYIYADGTADKTTVNAGGRMIVSEGGVAKATTVNTDASVHVSTGGKTNGFTVNSGGYLGVFAGGSATGIVENGGYVYVDDGAQVTFAPNSFSGLVLNKKDATVHSGTTATDVTVSGKGGMLVVFSGGLTNDVTVGPEGVLWINKDGLTNGLTVKSGGELIAGAGGKLTGRMTFEHGATVAPGAKAYLNFDLAQTAPGETALVNDLSFIPDTFTFTLTVNGTQENGLYNLAGGAAGFDQTLHVIAPSGKELGTLTVDGGTKTIGGEKYTLIRDEDELSLLVGDPLPPEPLNNDLVYKAKTDNDNKAVTGSYGTRLKAANQEIRLDQIDSINHDGYHNRVEKAVDDDSDNIDYAKIVLKHGAKLSFHAEATAAATFTVCGLKQNKKGKYSLKKLQTLKLTDKDKDGVFTADSKKLLQLQVSGAYYVSMQFTDKHTDEAYYNVSLNGEDSNLPSVFYNLGYNGDDWTGKKTKELTGLFADLGTVDAARLKTDNTIIKDEWIGFGDKVDCKKFTLESAAELSFTVSAPDGPLKLSVCKLKTSGTGDKTTYSLVKVKTITVKAGKGSADLNNLRLEADDYYFKVESTNVNKSTGYNVQVTQSTFYSDGDNGWNNVLLEKKALSADDAFFYSNPLGTGKVYFDKAGNDKESNNHATFVCEANKKEYENFVGYGDEVDFAKITLSEGSTSANVKFLLTATGDATLEVFKVTQKGEDKYTKKSLQTLKLKVGDEAEKTEEARKTVTLEYQDDVFYYVSVKATNTKKMPMVYYNVSYTIESSEASALTMPETSDSLGISDALNFGDYGTDALADAFASSLAELDDKLASLNIASLA